MILLHNLRRRLIALVDRIDARLDKPAKDRGTFTSGSEQMINSDMDREMGRSTAYRRSGYGRRM